MTMREKIIDAITDHYDEADMPRVNSLADAIISVLEASRPAAGVDDETILAAWKTWPQQAITGGERAVSFVRHVFGGEAKPAGEPVPAHWRDDVELAAQMLSWGDDEGGLTTGQLQQIRAHAKRLSAMLEQKPAAREEPAATYKGPHERYGFHMVALARELPVGAKLYTRPADSAVKDARIAELAHVVAEKTKQIDAAFPDPWGYQNTDARRYQRLQILGCAPMGHKCLENGTVLRFQTLDAFIDKDIERHPSRGESKRADDPVHIEIDLSELKNILHVLRNPHGWREDIVRKARLLAADALEQKPASSEEASLAELKAELAKEREDRLNCARMGIDLGNKCDQLRQQLEAVQGAKVQAYAVIVDGAFGGVFRHELDARTAGFKAAEESGKRFDLLPLVAAIAAQAGKAPT